MFRNIVFEDKHGPIVFSVCKLVDVPIFVMQIIFPGDLEEFTSMRLSRPNGRESRRPFGRENYLNLWLSRPFGRKRPFAQLYMPSHEKMQV